MSSPQAQFSHSKVDALAGRANGHANRLGLQGLVLATGTNDARRGLVAELAVVHALAVMHVVLLSTADGDGGRVDASGLERGKKS
jgi:hypothetical protein